MPLFVTVPAPGSVPGARAAGVVVAYAVVVIVNEIAARRFSAYVRFDRLLGFLLVIFENAAAQSTLIPVFSEEALFDIAPAAAVAPIARTAAGIIANNFFIIFFSISR